MNNMSDFIKICLTIALILWLPAAWMTHVITCFQAGEWGFLIAGAIFFPVAWVHGTWIWF